MNSPRRTPILAALLLALPPACSTSQQSGQLTQSTTWPMGAGPLGNWSVTGPAPVTKWSAQSGSNIVWRAPLAETGQGGIAIANGRAFVTTMAPWKELGLSASDAKKYAHATEKREVVGKHIDAHCFDLATGTLLWTRRIEGEVPSIYSYPFSDATSASPCCDEHYVWFTNAGGQVACFTHEGHPVWSRRFTPTYDGPFNKQFEPLLIDDSARGAGCKTLVCMEPTIVGGDEFVTPYSALPKWNILVGLDAKSGTELWTSEALTHYNAPTLVHTAEHGPCVLLARGGPHKVPERPVGMSLVRATESASGKAGAVVWRYEDPRGNHEGALQTMAADGRFAYWLLKKPHNLLVVLDVLTGQQVREISLVENVTLHEAPGVGPPTRTPDKPIAGVMPARYSMHAANGCLWFLTYATAWGKPTLGAPWSLARIDPVAPEGTPPTTYVELPTDRRGNYRTKLEARAFNSRGDEVTGDKRSRWDGWDWVFHSSPTQVNDLLFFTMPTGIVYAVDTSKSWPDNLCAINDLGKVGATWTGNSVSYANGRLYHRTARELLCIGTTKN